MLFKKPPTRLLALAAVLVIVLAAPTLAGAYCVYNHTNTDLYVTGEECLHCLQTTVKKGGKACCPGGDKGCRGHTYISFAISFSDNNVCNSFVVPKAVEAHGWVSLFGSCTREWKKCDRADACSGVTAKVHDKNGNVVYDGGVHQN